MVLIPSEVDLDGPFTTNVPETFIKNLGIRYHHIDVAVVDLDCVCVIVPGTVVGLCVTVFVVVHIETHVGYLHLNKASLMCSAFPMTNCHPHT